MHNNFSQVTAYAAVHDLDNTNDSPVSLPIPPKPWYMSKGWRLALFFAFLGTSAVFFLNLSITIWALAAHPITFGSGLLYQGSCSTTKQLNIGIHVIINAFSSVILSGSNYAMQCSSAPTRNEIDEAHAESNWMDIGVPSVRNLRRIGKARRLLWMLLALSSVPLHLFYNSVVFATLSANDYSGYVINEEWLTPNTRLEEIMQEPNKADARIYNDYHSGNLERLDPVNCIQAYSHAFVSSWGNLLVVTADNSSSPSDGPQLFDVFGGGDIHITGAMEAVNLDPVSWVCDPNASPYYNSDRPFCDVKPFLEDPSTWKLLGRKVEYCLSQRVEENCKLQLNATIAILVTVLNAVKAALLLYVCLSVKESPIMNIGDAVTSFLQRPDLETEGSCLLSREDITETKEDRKILRGPRPFQDTHKRWFTAAGRRRRHTVYFTISVAILVCCAFFIYGIFKMPGASPSDIWSLGFGEANEHTLMTFKGIRRRMIRTTGLLNSVLIANTGQLVLSFLYFACNGLLTSMLVSHEWSSYAHVRKGLRVSSQPQGHQRSTYFLQLPWRYSIPMIAIGTLLHWLGSQSIFLVTVEQWSNDRDTGTYVRDDFHDFATCGYSPLALLIFILAAVVSSITLIVIGFRKFKSGMPVVANCSLIIAAACHPEVRPEPENLTQLPLQWGVVGGVEDKDGESVWLWRCSFSSQEVEYPTEGTIYS